MVKKRSAMPHLRAFGHTNEHDDGGLVRHKRGAEHDKFTPVDGGYHFHVMEDGAWVQKFHHVDTGPNGEFIPNYLWPEEHVTHIYRAATDADYHAQIVTDGVVWDVTTGQLGHRETGS